MKPVIDDTFADQVALLFSQKDALNASIKYWEESLAKIGNGIAPDTRWESCTCCQRWAYTTSTPCFECPIWEYTGYTQCFNTPYMLIKKFALDGKLATPDMVHFQIEFLTKILNRVKKKLNKQCRKLSYAVLGCY